MRKQYDLLWKIILEPFFYDFLQLVDPDLADIIDASKKPGFLDKELLRQIPDARGDFEQRIVDKLVKLYTKSGTEEWILFHLEVQHSYRKDFSERMYQYFHSINQKFKRPIIAYALFTEAGSIKRDNAFKINYCGTSLEYNFNTYQIALQDNDALKSNPNHFALVILIAKQTNLKRRYKDRHIRDEKLLANKLEIAKLIFESDLPNDKEANLIYFLFYYVDFEFKENKTTFENIIKSFTDKNIGNMTMQEAILEETKFEGMRDGVEKTKEEIVTRMIQMQLASDKQIVKVAQVTPGFVSRLRKKVEKVK